MMRKNTAFVLFNVCLWGLLIGCNHEPDSANPGSSDNNESPELAFLGGHEDTFLIASANNISVQTIDGELVHSVPLNDGQASRILPDRTHVMTISTQNQAQLWDLSGEPKNINLVGTVSNILQATLSQDRKKCTAVSSNRTLFIWSIPEGTLERQLPLPGEGEIQQAVFSPLENRLLTVQGQAFELWDLSGPTLILQQTTSEPIVMVATQDKIQSVVVVHPHKFSRWDLNGSTATKRQEQVIEDNELVSARTSFAGMIGAVLAKNGMISIWDLHGPSSSRIAQFQGLPISSGKGAIAFHPTRPFLLSGINGLNGWNLYELKLELCATLTELGKDSSFSGSLSKEYHQATFDGQAILLDGIDKEGGKDFRRQKLFLRYASPSAPMDLCSWKYVPTDDEKKAPFTLDQLAGTGATLLRQLGQAAGKKPLLQVLRASVNKSLITIPLIDATGATYDGSLNSSRLWIDGTRVLTSGIDLDEKGVSKPRIKVWDEVKPGVFESQPLLDSDGTSFTDELSEVEFATDPRLICADGKEGGQTKVKCWERQADKSWKLTLSEVPSSVGNVYMSSLGLPSMQGTLTSPWQVPVIVASPEGSGTKTTLIIYQKYSDGAWQKNQVSSADGTTYFNSDVVNVVSAFLSTPGNIAMTTGKDSGKVISKVWNKQGSSNWTATPLLDQASSSFSFDVHSSALSDDGNFVVLSGRDQEAGQYLSKLKIWKRKPDASYQLFSLLDKNNTTYGQKLEQFRFTQNEKGVWSLGRENEAGHDTLWVKSWTEDDADDTWKPAWFLTAGAPYNKYWDAAEALPNHVFGEPVTFGDDEEAGVLKARAKVFGYKLSLKASH